MIKTKCNVLKKVSFLLAICLMVGFSLTSCSSTNTQSNTSDKIYFEFTDDLGNKVELTKKPTKVVALMGSYAELWELSGGKLVGVTEDAISERGMTLADNVKQIGSVKSPNMELVLECEPDFMILSTDIDQHKKLSDTLKSANIPHAYFKEDSYRDYLRILKLFTDINETPDLYKKHGESVNNQIDSLIKSIPPNTSDKKVLLIRSMSTKAKALKEDHMVGIMLKDLKTDNIASKHESLLEDLSMETIIEENPDFIFAVTMGDRDAAVKTLENTVMKNPAWKNLKAVKNGNFYILPKDLFQYKPNARWGESYEYLKKILYK